MPEIIPRIRSSLGLRPYHMISNIIINKIYIFQSIRYKSNNHYDMYQCGIIIKNVKDNQSYDENEQWHEFI